MRTGKCGVQRLKSHSDPDGGHFLLFTMLPYAPGPINVDDVFGVNETGENKYVGKRPLLKPLGGVRGAYGGNIAGQALLVAMKSCPPEMTPHSFHLYFVKAVLEDSPMNWEVTHVSDGRNFNNRLVKGFQDGKLKYVAIISLTKRNSFAREQGKYDKWAEERRKAGKPVAVSIEDDDIDDMPLKPFLLQTPFRPKWVNSPKEVEINTDGQEYLTYHKFPKQLYDLSLTKEEEKLDPTDRKLSWYQQFGCDEDGVNQPIVGMNKQYQHVGLAVISDLWLMALLARTLRLDVGEGLIYSCVTLDHVIYFHDDDFDVTKWMGFSQRTLRYANSRLLCEAEVYNDKGVHVATLVQEALVDIRNVIRDHKL